MTGAPRQEQLQQQLVVMGLQQRQRQPLELLNQQLNQRQNQRCHQVYLKNVTITVMV